MADLHREIMVIDEIRVTAQPCVFLAINSTPPPISNPLAFFEPRMPGEQSASTDNQYLPSLFWGARAREMHVAKKKKKKTQLETQS